MDAALYFSLMNDIKPTGEKAGSLRKGVVSSVVPYATFGDVIDLMIWMADGNRSHPGHEAYGIVATRFQPCAQHHACYPNMRYRRHRLIASAEHFRSYFAFSISDDVIPAERMDELLLRADDPEYVIRSFREALAVTRRVGTTQAALLLEELQVYAEDIDEAKVTSLASSLFRIADELDVETDIYATGWVGNSNMSAIKSGIWPQ